MTGPRRRMPVLAIALALTSGLTAGAAVAQDPAFIGGSSRNDPANLQSRRSQSAAPALTAPAGSRIDPRNLPPGVSDPDALDPSPMRPQAATHQLEGMIQQLYNSASGSTRDPFDRTQQVRYDTMMKQTDALVRANWNQLAPSTQALYRELHALDQEQRSEQAALGNRLYNDPDVAYTMGKRQAEDGMRRLGDVLMPMLQDVKRALDTELRNAAIQR
jgi:hypothetical protein